MKWFGSPAIGPTTTINGFTASTSAENIAEIITMMRDMMIARTIATTTTATRSGDSAVFETPAFGPAFCFPER